MYLDMLYIVKRNIGTLTEHIDNKSVVDENGNATSETIKL